jgi:putative transposase
MEDWLGVDMNTNGHIAVLAHPASGKVIRLGKNVHHIHAKYEKIRKKCEKQKKHRKLKRIESLEKCILDDLVTRVSRQIIDQAKALKCGIKLERIYGARNERTFPESESRDYSITCRSFQRLQKLIESKALKTGVSVAYVDPAYTSQICWKCGKLGKRNRKKFECPHCGHTAHADVNAAFNIADAAVKPEVSDAGGGTARRQSRFYRALFRDIQEPFSRSVFDLHPLSGISDNILCLLELN